MLIDRARAARAFAAYVRPYNSADPKVALKISHTYRVAALCERIAPQPGAAAAGCGPGLAVRAAARCRPL